MSSDDALALIPARGGSKSIPLKNLATVGGKTLLQHAIDAARDSGVIDRIVVSSDSELILEAAAGLGAEPLRRPAELASDSAGSDCVVAHCIDELALLEQRARPMVLLQPTSPLRTAEHIVGAMEVWKRSAAHCVVSVFEPDHHPAKSFRVDQEGMLTGLFAADAPFTPRQMLPRAFLPNGAIYVFSIEAFTAQSRIPRERLVPYVMPARSSIDIDQPGDLAEAARLLRGE